MIVLVQATVLTVGLNDKNEMLRDLPVHLIAMKSGIEAARSLKNKNVDSVVCKWDLCDMKNGQFVKGLRSVHPDIPTVVFVEAGNVEQEIAARSLGVSAVLPSDTGEFFVRETIANVLGLNSVVAIKNVSTVS
jgi:DNA-binding NarL/FixJ family response regulator